jgi:hypothetical protein
MREKKDFTISDEDFSLEIDGLHVNMWCACTTKSDKTFKHIFDYKAKNEDKARQMFKLLQEGDVYLDGGEVTT